MTTPTADDQITTVWNENRAARAALSHVVTGHDPMLKMRLDVDEPAEVWAHACYADEVYAPRIKQMGLEPGRMQAKAATNGWRFLIPGDQEWPNSLDDLGTQAPLGLWANGPVRLDDASHGRDAIAFTGPRHTSADEVTLAVQIGRTLADNHKTLITGLTVGAQHDALAAALDAGGRVVAVTPGSLPGFPLNQQRSRIASTGVLVSHRPFDLMPSRDDHAQTMRIVAALADALIYCTISERSSAAVALQTAATKNRRLINLCATETFTSTADILAALDD